MYDHQNAFLEEELNFPKFDFKIAEQDGKPHIFDPLRKKLILLTPEEWVRQHFIAYLIQGKNYPKSLFAIERGLQYNQLQKRFDILVHDRMGKPFLLVECKASNVNLTDKTIKQIGVYNLTIGAPYLGISNGRKHIFVEYDRSQKRFIQINDLPDFDFENL